MEGLAPFLLFLFFMIINIYTGQKRREPKKKQKQEFPDIYDNPPPRQNRKRNLDYMMAKPRGNNDNIEIVANDLQQEKINDLAQYIDKYEQDLQNRYQEKLKQNRTNLQAKDFIQQTEIKAVDKDKKNQKDIKKHKKYATIFIVAYSFTVHNLIISLPILNRFIITFSNNI